MTKTQAKLIDTIKAGIADGTWTAITGDTVRYTETVETPETNRGRGFGRWPEPTYTRHLFITVIAGKSWSILLRSARAPWAECQDTKVTFKRAFEILTDPAAQF